VVPHLDIPVTEQSQVGEARRAANRLATGHDLDETVRGRVAIIVTELGNNLWRHAQKGRLLVGCRMSDEGCQLEVISIDSGPGMADVSRCLRDGYSSGGTQGTGLGAVQRLSTDFSVFSSPGKGTVILSRTWVPSATAPGAPSFRARFAHAGICLAAPGEVISGDAWDVRIDGTGVAMVIVADGLGHGPIASDAAAEALKSFGTLRGSPAAVLERMHPALRTTRGAAVSIAELDANAGTLVYAGAGNISGRMISGVEDRSLMSQHGTLGVQIRKLQDMSYAWPDHSIVVLHSDGLATRWNLKDVGGLLQCDPAVIAGWLLRDHTRGHDDVTVVVLKRG
jgi:anti-sigma regulatory factor (Ser/Thr protein kinase)